MLIRRATSADTQAIWALLEPVFAAGQTYAVPRDITRDAALDLWCNIPAATFVAEYDGEVLGTFYIKTNAQGGGAHVCNCGYVTADHAQGRGIARQMCERSQVEAAALGYKAMQFNLVLSSNIGAVALWHKLGFETIGVLPRAFDHPQLGYVHAHVMYKELGGAAADPSSE